MIPNLTGHVLCNQPYGFSQACGDMGALYRVDDNCVADLRWLQDPR